jgi:hypothetical protein
VPAGKRVLPALVRRTLPCGSTPAAEVLQATMRATVSSIAGLGATVSYVPIIDTPTVPALKPPAWAPMTARETPPARPSQAVPKRSTSTL